MAAPFIQSSFSAGELAPQMWGRTDLARYKNGLAVCRNFFVDYRGGVSTRPGTSFVGPAPFQNSLVRLFKFVFSSTQAYVLEFTEGLIRFIYQGAYVIDQTLNVASVTPGLGLPATFTLSAVPSGIASGDQVYAIGFEGLLLANGVSGINTRTLIISLTGTNTCQLFDAITGLGVIVDDWTPYVSGGTLEHIYYITSPYQDADLFALKFTQSADVLDIAHVNYQPAQLKRLAATDWVLTTISFAPVIQPPTGLYRVSIFGPNLDGQLSVLQYFYYVTSVAQNGEESVASAFVTVANNPLNQTTGCANLIGWQPVTGARGYRVYAAIPVIAQNWGNLVQPPFFCGYIGTTTSTTFVDDNIEPDFTQTPPTAQNPFQSSQIVGVTLVTPGYGYINPIVTITDPTGSGAEITATANDAGNGAITGFTVVTGGTGYSAPTLTIGEGSPAPGTGLVLAFSGSWTAANNGWQPASGSITITAGGTHYHAPNILLSVAVSGNVTGQTGGDYSGTTTGAVVTGFVVENQLTVFTNNGAAPANTITFTINDGINAGQATATALLEGNNNPGVVSYFDQRKAFAGTVLQPATFFLSQVGLYENFNTSFPSQASDALTETIVSSEVNIINSLTPMAGGLIALTTSGAYQISGGTPGAALTPTSITAQAQAFSGANALQPIRVNYDLIYMQARGSAVRDLTYNFYLNVYTGQDISAQSAHLFYGRTIVQWDYAEEPYKIVWGVRDDGIMLALTIMKEQEILGWSRHDTAGQYMSVISIPEGDEDAVYVAVNRWFNNQFYPVVERMASRKFGGNPAANIPSNPENAWCLDCAVVLPPTPAQFAITSGAPYDLGILANLTVDFPGKNYDTEAPYVQVLDCAGSGSGAEIYATIEDGGVNSLEFELDPFGDPLTGNNYVQPVLQIIDPAGLGSEAQGSAAVQNIWAFYYDGDTNPTPPPGVEVGQIIRIQGGYGIVTAISDGQGDTRGGGASLPAGLYANMLVAPFGLVPNTAGELIVPPVAAGDWSLSDPVTVVGGVSHFEGCTVGIVADGNVLPPQEVVDGCVTLPGGYTYVLVGAQFTAQVQTLPFAQGGEGPTDQGRRKQLPAVTLRTVDTRGIAVGSSFGTLVEQKERTNEAEWRATQFTLTAGWQDYPFDGGPVSPIPPEYGDIRTVLDVIQQEQGFVCIQQNYPMPCTVLAEIPEVSEGDTPDP